MPSSETFQTGTVVAVLGERQGSGVMVSPRMVLTCAHVVGLGRTAKVAAPGQPAARAFRVGWIDHDVDAALLLPAAGTGVRFTSERFPQIGIRIGTISTDQPVQGCYAAGFPDVQRYDGRKLEADQYRGTVLPLAGLVRRTMVFACDQPPAAERPDGTSPLAGLSGGPVFAGRSLLGIVRQVPRGRRHQRIECVPVSRIFSHPDFLEWYAETVTGIPVLRPPAPALERITRASPEDTAYEEQYAEALAAQYRRTQVFGLDALGRHGSEWDLDTAYLSLEAAAGEPASATTPAHRVEDMLAARPRVLLRGDAGAGKTTLVWRLAARAAAGTLGPELAALNGLVPFVVPLRSVHAQGSGHPTVARLPEVARLVVDEPPRGWAGRVLAADRALLLVDGLDEVPGAEREEARRWLAALLRRHPGLRCLATVRPLAVEPDWLAGEGFEELRLLPMRDEDVQEFTAAWHTAARLDDPDHAGLRGLERDLAQQFARNPQLRDLARTPLLCAVICALHRQRQGFLPETRWELYRSALEMLLGERDKRRRVGAPEGITMTVEEHQQLLQRIAAAMVRGGQAEFTRDQALRQLGRTLKGMSRVSAQGGAPEVLAHLLNRSGLLRERTDESYEFIHRTFQDFLAAKEFTDNGDLDELVLRSQEQQWQDVLVLAAGHCSRRDLAELVQGLLAVPDPVQAALCAQHASWLDEPLADRVREAVRGLLPPADRDAVVSLKRLGPYVLPLLPDPEGLDDEALYWTSTLALESGDTGVLPYLTRLALLDRPVPTTEDLAGAWDRYPAERYAREVLAHRDLTPVSVYVSTREQLDALPGLGPVHHLTLTAAFGTTELAERLPADLVRLHVQLNSALVRLPPLDASARTLRELSLQCSALKDVSALAGLRALRVLALDAAGLPPDQLTVLGGLDALSTLRLGRLFQGGSLTGFPALTGVKRLLIDAGTFDGVGLGDWQGLTEASFDGLASNVPALLAEAVRLPLLTSLGFGLPALAPLDGAAPLPQVTRLRLSGLHAFEGAEHVARVFPGLRSLRLKASRKAHDVSWDLTPLHDLPGLKIRFARPPASPVLGAEAFGDRISVDGWI
ncbi:NACHT domain-containing protein [Streptomyces sp. NPDC001941]|uniref:NACHT domain-containing protein n=1 Tax=Streptomyces sp. NPDC001941 TaxID=3154659 RepID=UPI00333088B1